MHRAPAGANEPHRIFERKRAALAHPTTHTALLGFNPLTMARPAFRPVAEQVLASRRGTVLTPVIGPEPLAGSTRMKGGTATLLVLGSILDDAMAPEQPDRAARMAQRLLRLDAVLERFADPGFLGGGVNVAANRVDVMLMVADASTQARYDEQYGAGAVAISSWLQPVG